jgi:RNA polymerase sigma-70 factor, ECF subfamily
VPGDQRQTLDKQALDRAFTDLYKEHLRDVYSFLYYRLGNHHDAEDVSEQVFLQAYRHLPKALAESNGRSLRPWLIRIAQNLAINLYRDRSRKPQSPLEAAGEFADLHDTEQLVAAREELAHVFEKVAGLSDDRREALIMRFALGMDNQEIATALGKSEGATKVLLHRAIKQLGEQLVADGEHADVAGKQLLDPPARS